MIEKMIDIINEIKIWEGKPDKVAYVIGPIYMYIVAIIWGIIDFACLSAFTQGEMTKEALLIIIPFFALHLIPFWLGIISPIYRFLEWKNVHYVITDKCIYLQSGLRGKNITTLKLTDAKDPVLKSYLIDKKRDCGSIYISPYTYRDSDGDTQTAYKAKILHVNKPQYVFDTLIYLAENTKRKKAHNYDSQSTSK